MGNESNALAAASSNRRTWIIVAMVAFCVLLACCLLVVVGGVFFFWPRWSGPAAAPESQTIPALPDSPVIPALPEIPAVTAVPAGPLVADTPPLLDETADPLFGSVSLQRGFSPDPHVVTARAGGSVDTSKLGLDCGFASSPPTFTFRLSGGASAGFLRIFFVTSDGLDTTLIVRTPDETWLCVDNSITGSEIDPVVDLEFAPSGQYAIWVGARQPDTYGAGSLFITQLAGVAP